MGARLLPSRPLIGPAKDHSRPGHGSATFTAIPQAACACPHPGGFLQDCSFDSLHCGFSERTTGDKSNVSSSNNTPFVFRPPIDNHRCTSRGEFAVRVRDFRRDRPLRSIGARWCVPCSSMARYHSQFEILEEIDSLKCRRLAAPESAISESCAAVLD
jgi:hypothetical protein